MVATDKQTTDRQTTDSYYPIVPGGKSARDKKHPYAINIWNEEHCKACAKYSNFTVDINYIPITERKSMKCDIEKKGSRAIMTSGRSLDIPIEPRTT